MEIRQKLDSSKTGFLKIIFVKHVKIVLVNNLCYQNKIHYSFKQNCGLEFFRLEIINDFF